MALDEAIFTQHLVIFLDFLYKCHKKCTLFHQYKCHHYLILLLIAFMVVGSEMAFLKIYHCPFRFFDYGSCHMHKLFNIYVRVKKGLPLSKSNIPCMWNLLELASLPQLLCVSTSLNIFPYPAMGCHYCNYTNSHCFPIPIPSCNKHPSFNMVFVIASLNSFFDSSLRSFDIKQIFIDVCIHHQTLMILVGLFTITISRVIVKKKTCCKC